MTLEASLYKADKEILGGHEKKKEQKAPLSMSIFHIKQQINHESDPQQIIRTD